MHDDPAARTVSLFRNGANQALRIPREFELPGTTAVLTREGDALVLRPAKPRSLLAALSGLKPIRATLADFEDLPPDAVELE